MLRVLASRSAAPHLLRYNIVKTNAKDLTQQDSAGNVPLHYGAKLKPKPHDAKTHFPVEDADGKIPLTLAVIPGKQWIGGGIKSLYYDAHPDPSKQIQIEEHKYCSISRSWTESFKTNNPMQSCWCN
jgi:hypothetical protein